MEKKPVPSIVLVLIACMVALFSSYYRALFTVPIRYVHYLIFLAYLRVTTLVLFRRRDESISSMLFFDFIFLFTPYIEWQKRALTLTFSGILYIVPVIVYL